MAEIKRAIIFDCNERLCAALKRMLETSGPWIVKSVRGMEEAVDCILSLGPNAYDLYLVGEPTQRAPDNEESETLAWLIHARELGGCVVGNTSTPLTEADENLPPSDAQALADYAVLLEDLPMLEEWPTSIAA